jgi:hypothetical protein
VRWLRPPGVEGRQWIALSFHSPLGSLAGFERRNRDYTEFGPAALSKNHVRFLEAAPGVKYMREWINDSDAT